MPMENPFQIIDARLSNIETLLLDLKHNPQVLKGIDSPIKTIFNIDEFCQYTGLSKQTVYKKTGKGLLPHSKRGKRLFFDKEKVDAWLLENSVKSLSEIEASADRYLNGRKRKGGKPC